MYKRKDYPKDGEYVICTVEEISDISIRVNLNEYESFSGIIPMDELSNKRITNPRIILKEGKTIVCLVLDVDIKNRLCTLSYKRVDKNKQKAKVIEYKKENMAYNVLKIMSEKENIDTDKIYDEVIDKIIKTDKLYNVFLDVLINGKSVLNKYKINKKILDKLYQYIKEYLNPPKYKFDYILEAYNIEGDGILKLKEFLLKIKELNLEVKYLGSPRYMIRYYTINPKDLQSKEKKLLDLIDSEAKKYNIVYEISKNEGD
ncbi:translation initiation factor 2 subunit alpha [Nanobdella aerobiophila]|uniref:Translation initiation factor 2 subunit alpha n=1 Tax=Nanobdella aerobiophila TaxID=2586965 RepID=A0A915SKG5_9ARCH|nr:hypothetical protein [Nanobdella aerobiophila]BBL45623.1 translation initiation factor 2 subunit alpha [Nanobdella aerobiophila]